MVQTCGAEGGCNLLNVDGMVLIGWFKHVGQKEGIICRVYGMVLIGWFKHVGQKEGIIC